MNFQTPAALLLLASVPVAALLLLRGLRRRTRRMVAFPLLAGLVDSLPQLPRSHLARRRLQVALFLAALACAAAAAGGPVLGAADDPPQRAAIMIDDLSLWRDGAGRRPAWDLLLAETASFARRFREDDRVLVVRSGGEVVGGGPLQPRRAAELIGKLRPALAATDAADAAGYLAALSAAHGATQVLIVTPDPGRWAAASAGRGGGWSVLGIPPPPLPGGNHAILDVELRADFFTPGRVALFCRIGAFGEGVRGTGPLTLRVTSDERTLAERSFNLTPGETRGEVFPELDVGIGVLRVELSPRDSFPDDDLYLAPLRERPRLPVELVTEGNAALEAALRAVPGVELKLSRPPGGRPVAGRIRAFDRAPPPDERGALLVIAPPQGMPGLPYRGDAIEPREIRAEGAGALLRGVETRHLRPKRLPILVLPDGVEPVLTADGHPLVAAGRTPAGARLALVAFDPAESEWTRDPSFPILVANLVAWLAEDLAATRSSLLVGERLPGELAETVGRLADPTGAAVPVPDGGWREFRFPLPGAWRLDGAAPGSGGELFVNLLDERVSAAMTQPSPVARAPAGLPSRPRPFRADARGSLLVVAIALLVLERLVAPRRSAGRLT